MAKRTHKLQVGNATDGVTLALSPKQKLFTDSKAIYRGFVAGIGAGKSMVGAYDLLRRSEPKALYAVVAPTFRLLSDATMRSFIEVAEKLGLWDESKYRKTDNQAILNNGAEILFRSGDEPGKLRGPNLRGAWLDECSQMKEDVFNVMIGRLRYGGEQGWLTGTFTPSGKLHWTFRVFGNEENKNVFLVHCSTKDNPFVSIDFYNNLVAQYGLGEGGELRAKQELEGLFVQVGGSEWGPENFPPSIWFDSWPRTTDAVKIAALDSSKGIGGKHGDYSAFTLMMVADGMMYVDADLDNTRNTSMIVDRMLDIQRNFQPEFFGIEQAFGAEILADSLERAIQNLPQSFQLAFNPVLIPTGNIQKEIRIRRLTPYLTNGLFRFKRTAGSRLLVNQLEAFPGGDHDDGCFVAGTLVDTQRGKIAIENVTTHDLAKTRSGYFPIKSSRCTGVKDTIVVQLANGRTLTGTHNHPVFANNSWVPLGSLQLGDKVACLESTSPQNQKPSFLTELHFAATQRPSSGRIECTIRRMPTTLDAASPRCTKKSGSRYMDPFQTTWKSTTLTTIHLTTASKIWLASPMRSITQSTAMNDASGRLTIHPRWTRRARPQRLGMRLKKDWSGTGNTARTCLATVLSSRSSVPIVDATTQPTRLGEQSFAPPSVGSDFTHAGTDTEFQPQPIANFAETNLHPCTQNAKENQQNTVPVSVDNAAAKGRRLLTDSRVVSMYESAKPSKVYNLTVDSEHEYFANGILVHNCDSLDMALSVAKEIGLFSGTYENEQTALD